jgi:hypothetical protein
MMYDTHILRIPYPGLKKTLQYLLDQSIISIPYCAAIWGTNNTIRDIWTIGKQNLTYINDKSGVEQIQSVGTLFENNIHGKSGGGDCDCFSVFAVAMLLASGVDPSNIYIVLQGRKKDIPSHILIGVEQNGEFIFLDFTQPHYNTIRSYNFYQILPIKKFM